MKKGILYTVSILIISISFLGLLVAISNYSNSLSSIATPLSDFESLNFQFDSASNGIKSILENEFLNVSSENSNLTFSYDTSLYQNYVSDSSLFSQFIGNYSSVQTTINNSKFISPIIYVTPQNLTFDYSDKLTHINFSDSSSASTLNGYSIILTAPIPTPQLDWIEKSTLAKGNPNSMRFHLAVVGTNGTVSTTEYLDKLNPSNLNLLNAQNFSIINISISIPANLTIFHNPDMYLKIIVDFNTSSQMQFGQNMIQVNNSEGLKRGGVILDES